MSDDNLSCLSTFYCNDPPDFSLCIPLTICDIKIQHLKQRIVVGILLYAMTNQAPSSNANFQSSHVCIVFSLVQSVSY